MRLHRAAWLLVLCASFAGCGDDDARDGVRLRVLTSEIDGAIEGQLRVQSAEERDKIFDLERMSDDDPDLYIGPGVPPGRYRVFTDKGWGMLWSGGLGQSVPFLRGAGEPITPVRMGRPHTIYIAPTDPALWQLGETWGADFKPASDPTGDFRPAPFEQHLDPEGIISLRFRAQVWELGNVIRVLGQMTSGHVTNLLSYVVKDAQLPDLPRLALVHGAAHAPLRLVLVPTSGSEPVPDGIRAQVVLSGMPFPSAYEEKSFRGMVRFDGVAALGGGLRVALPDLGKHALWHLGTNERRLAGGMHLVALDPRERVEFPLASSPDPFVAAYARYPGGRALGRLPLVVRADGSVHLQTVAGKQDLWLRTKAGGWVHTAADIPATDISAPDLPKARDGCRMKGSVRGGGRGYRIDFRPILEEGPIDGFTAVVSHTGEYDVSLPPGTFEIQVIGPTGSKSKARTQDLRPGQTVRMNLSAR